jgi:hypothetical protein
MMAETESKIRQKCPEWGSNPRVLITVGLKFTPLNHSAILSLGSKEKLDGKTKLVVFNMITKPGIF